MLLEVYMEQVYVHTNFIIMKRIGIYGKSIPKENYKFINSLVNCIRKEITPQIFLFKELIEIPNLFIEDDDLMFGGDDLINSNFILILKSVTKQ